MPFVRILTDIEDKRRTRPLQEEAFHDPKGFVDYYYREKNVDNTMFVLEEGPDVLSMLHCNPYTVSICGRSFPAYYIVAVATKKEHRRKGYMRIIMDEALAFLAKERIPFCFLIPMKEEIYTDFGFRTICDFVTREDERFVLSYEDVRRDYDIYCVRDEIYLKRQEEEDRLALLGDSEELPPDPVIMARVTCAPVLARALSMPETASDAELIERIKTLRCYFKEEV